MVLERQEAQEHVPSSHYYFQSISLDLNFRNFYGSGGGAPSATKIPENSKEPEITKAPGNNNEPGEPENTDGGVLEDTNNNQPVNADTTGEDKGQGSTAVSGKKLVIKKTKITMKAGQKSNIKITSQLNTKVTYKSLNPSVAVVSKKGRQGIYIFLIKIYLFFPYLCYVCKHLACHQYRITKNYYTSGILKNKYLVILFILK